MLKIIGPIAVFLGLLNAASAAPPAFESDPPKLCPSCQQWNRTNAPFRIFGNTYYVGVAGLSSILIASDDGLILLDGALPQSAPLIAENIRKLGFRVKNIRLIVNSHTHFDHAGGIAALQRASHAPVAASPASALALKQGGPAADDPQFAFGREKNSFQPVPAVRAIGDGESLRVGILSITAHFTPGHTPGSTTWTWRSCEGNRCLDIVYADSLNPVSAPDFRFTGDARHESKVAAFDRSIALVEALPCDVLLTPHPDFFDMDGKLQRQLREPDTNPFVDPQACKAYAASAKQKLQQRIAQELAASSTGRASSHH